MNEIGFVDTTLRDGQQSLWAERMTTGSVARVPVQSSSGSHPRDRAYELIAIVFRDISFPRITIHCSQSL